jgi:flagellar biosynthetic protein FlhB
MKMSRRELKEEVRRREGDPEIRARIRALRKEAAKRGKALQRVPEADVLITNPTHLAVALLYKRGEMSAPQVIAKGSGELAQNMKRVARKHHVPVVENKDLARRLFRQVEIEAAVPESLYPPIAQLLAWVYKHKQAGVADGRMNA